MRKWIKRTGIGVGGLVAVVLAAVAVVYAASEMRFRRELQIAAAPLSVQPAPGLVERGRHLATAVGKCGDCHGANLGGTRFLDAGPLGTVIASNLTSGRGGVLAKYDDAALERAIRHGVGQDGRGLFIMPSTEFYHFSDQDVAAIIAYLRTVPPVDNELPASEIRTLGRALYMAGQLPLVPAEKMDHSAPRLPAAPGVTVEYGRYLATVGGCTGCHGADLAGAPSHDPNGPPAANLTPAPAALGNWSEADFFRALRTGVRPSGTAIDASMPWASSGRMTDDEIRALWMYLRTVPAKETPKA
ncbi:MAG TPA: cytochrome c [Longimicrobium sp.]|jgi:cytochrome c553